ncbi:MAG TPA: hypothetical protein PL110_08785 [Candidatus Eremiobacteraeota bacterium]|nr:hypothetical protein [Candidatus Eremiobacteraeota bacterium]
MKGHSVLELILTMLIFSLFLLAMTQIFNVGLKSWNLIEMKTALEQESTLSLNLLKRDLFLSDNMTVQVGGKGKEFVIMESAVDEKGVFHYNEKTGVPVWQAFILYYTYPRDGGDAKLSISLDLNNPEPEKSPKKKLIRKIMRHNPSEVATRLTNYWLYFTDSISPPIQGEDRIGKPHILAKHMDKMVISESSVDSDNALDIELLLVKSILEDRLAYEKNFAYNVGYERLTIKGSVFLKNTKKQ